jgi:hypothetical protein
MKKVIELISNAMKEYGKAMDSYGTAILKVKMR